MVPILQVLSFCIVPLRYICGQETTSLQVNELVTLPKTSHVGKKNQKHAKTQKIDSFFKNLRGKKKKNKKYTFAPLSYPTSAPLLPITFGPAVTLSSAPSFKISSDDSDGSDDGTQFASDDGTQGTQFASDDGSLGCNPDECTGICKPKMAEFSEILTTFATSKFLKWFSMFPFIQDYGEEAFSTSIASKWNSYEEVPNSTGSYLLCNTDPELTGHQRTLFISSSCNLENVAESPVHNSVERTCFKAMLDFSSAHYCCTRPHMWVVPFTQWMKISENSIWNALEPLSDVRKFARNYWSTDTIPIGDRFSITFCDPNYEMRDFTDHLEEVWNNIEECSNLPSFRNFVEFDEENSFQFNNIGSIFNMCMSWNILKSSRCIINSVSCILEFITSIPSSGVVCELEYNPPIEFFDPDDIEILQVTTALRYHLDDAAFLHEKNIKGQGQVAQLSDSGVHVDSCYFYDQDGTVNRDNSEIFDESKRKIIQYYTPLENDGDSNGHGTHVAGVIAGQMCPYQNSRCESSDTNGVAPRAKLAVYDIYRAGKFFDPKSRMSIEKMLNMGRDSGAFLHSASWVKTGTNNNYKAFDKIIDEYLWKNHDYLAIFAAGNKGYEEGAGSVKHVGKNLISVCNAHTKEYVFFSSSRGPALGGQIKPDICAPGTLISSAGLDDCSEATMSGTSQAAPALAGIALLIRQYFIEGWYPSGIKKKEDGFNPSGYLVKAVMMNSGKKLSGVYTKKDGTGIIGSSKEYDTIQGFGLVSLTDGIFISGRSAMKRMKVFDEQLLTGSENLWRKTFNVRTGGCTSRYSSITLDYYDKPAGSIINHLDLSVRINGHEHYPNGLTQKGRNQNTSQRIRLENLNDKDEVNVSVDADIVVGPQYFSLVLTGCFDFCEDDDISFKSSIPSVSTEFNCDSLYKIDTDFKNNICRRNGRELNNSNIGPVKHICPKACGFRKECFCRDTEGKIGSTQKLCQNVNKSTKATLCSNLEFWNHCPIRCGNTYCR